MKHIIEDRYASIYSTVLPDYRVGPSCPVVFNTRLQVSRWRNRRGGYQAVVVREHNGRRCTFLETRPTSGAGEPVIMEAGQYSSYYPAVLG